VSDRKDEQLVETPKLLHKLKTIKTLLEYHQHVFVTQDTNNMELSIKILLYKIIILVKMKHLVILNQKS